ncbi:hypothetical protein [Ferrimonas marina]|uniref:Uncharacterized protein n=1 Tax=Ferrimonas marina TaxID=299255 RepID=A0A1M5U568_9GAMM|nr:hypothetical protein [Ferrimonas marina]SHH58088.1 hypothetical protein SAMN02745129_2412 [Ferrimonas marina]
MHFISQEHYRQVTAGMNALHSNGKPTLNQSRDQLAAQAGYHCNAKHRESLPECSDLWLHICHHHNRLSRLAEGEQSGGAQWQISFAVAHKGALAITGKAYAEAVEQLLTALQDELSDYQPKCSQGGLEFNVFICRPTSDSAFNKALALFAKLPSAHRQGFDELCQPMFQSMTEEDTVVSIKASERRALEYLGHWSTLPPLIAHAFEYQPTQGEFNLFSYTPGLYDGPVLEQIYFEGTESNWLGLWLTQHAVDHHSTQALDVLDSTGLSLQQISALCHEKTAEAVLHAVCNQAAWLAVTKASKRTTDYQDDPDGEIQQALARVISKERERLFRCYLTYPHHLG